MVSLMILREYICINRCYAKSFVGVMGPVSWCTGNVLSFIASSSSLFCSKDIGADGCFLESQRSHLYTMTEITVKGNNLEHHSMNFLCGKRQRHRNSHFAEYHISGSP